MLGVLDPDQGFRADWAAGSQVDDRLVLDDDAFFVEGAAQHALNGEPADGVGSQLLVKGLRAVAALVLGPVEGHIRFGEQFFGTPP